ncbi:MAG: LysR family transcriptional regulator [Burkholderiales bacterium]
MKLQRIEHFIEVVAAGSIRGAARRLGVSQPALTRSLQQLEQDLGVQLMRRSVRGASLTPAGSTFLARARVAHAELGKAAEEARRSVDDVSGLVTVGVSPVGASLLLPELVTTLQRQHPRSRIRILEMAPSALLPMVREGAVELAVTQRTRANLDAGLQYRPLFDIQLRIAACTGHPLSGTRELHELAGSSWIAPTAPGISDDIITQSFLAIGLPAPVPAVHCASYFLALDMVAATDMLVPVPPPLLRSCIAAGKVIEIPLTKALVPLRVGLYTRADSPPLPATKAVTQIVVAIARRFAASGELRTAVPFTDLAMAKPRRRIKGAR